MTVYSFSIVRVGDPVYAYLLKKYISGNCVSTENYPVINFYLPYRTFEYVSKVAENWLLECESDYV